MVDTKSRSYSNLGRLSEGEYSVPFFSTPPSPSFVLPVTNAVKMNEWLNKRLCNKLKNKRKKIDTKILPETPRVCIYYSNIISIYKYLHPNKSCQTNPKYNKTVG